MSSVSESFGVTPSSSSSSPQNNSPSSNSEGKGKKNLVVTTAICAKERFKQFSPQVKLPRSPERTSSQPEIEG